MTRLDEAIREFADTADDALRRALAVWAQIRAEAQS